MKKLIIYFIIFTTIRVLANRAEMQPTTDFSTKLPQSLVIKNCSPDIMNGYKFCIGMFKNFATQTIFVLSKGTNSFKYFVIEDVAANKDSNDYSPDFTPFQLLPTNIISETKYSVSFDNVIKGQLMVTYDSNHVVKDQTFIVPNFSGNGVLKFTGIRYVPINLMFN